MDSDNLGNVFTVFTREVIDPNYPEIADAEIFYFTRDAVGEISEPMQITDNEAFETIPNPFNPETVIEFDVPQTKGLLNFESLVNLSIYDA